MLVVICEESLILQRSDLNKAHKFAGSPRDFRTMELCKLNSFIIVNGASMTPPSQFANEIR